MPSLRPTDSPKSPLGGGEKAKVAIDTITAIEEGRAKPSEVTGNKLAKVLEVRPDQIEEVYCQLPSVGL